VSVRSPNDVSVQIVLFLEAADANMGRLVSVFGLPPDVVAATLGDIGVKEVVDIASGVSPIPDAIVSSLHVVTAHLFRSRTTLPSVSTGASRSATSRGVHRPRTSCNPGWMETLSPSTEEMREPPFPHPPRTLLLGDFRVWTHADNFKILFGPSFVWIAIPNTHGL
jgi:hypothetical protein